jgi:hypothetical protein
MAKVTALKALQGFFNTGDGVSLGGEFTRNGNTITLDAGVPVKRALRDFAAELKDLTPEEKAWMAEEVCKVTGDTLS